MVTIAAGSLLPSNTYRFQCSDPATGGSATATVAVAAQPAVGRVAVTPTARSDTFTVAAEDFVSSVPNGALVYEYRYLLNAAGEKYPPERLTSPLQHSMLAQIPFHIWVVSSCVVAQGPFKFIYPLLGRARTTRTRLAASTQPLPVGAIVTTGS